MKINGWDIENADARQWNVIPNFSSIKNNSEWKNGTLSPILLNGTNGFKTIQIVLLVRGPDREGILQNCSTILSKLKGAAHLELDGFEHKFHGVMSKYTFTENPMNRQRVSGNKISKLSFTFSCYEYAEQSDGTPYSKTVSEEKEIVVENPGNIYTPCIVEITPKVKIAKMTISGISRDVDTGENLQVTIKNMQAEKTTVLDGAEGLFTEEETEKSADLEIWTLPMLAPGTNTITLSNDQTEVTIKYRPRYI